MISRISPSHARVGDVTAAMMQVDSLLARVRDPSRAAAGQPDDTLLGSFVDPGELLDGFGTLIYLFVTALRRGCEAAGQEVLQRIVPEVVSALRQMPKTVAPEAVPTMAAMLTAAAVNLSPTLWREQYGPWGSEELNAVEATALVLAEHVNFYNDDDNAAHRLVVEALAGAEDDEDDNEH